MSREGSPRSPGGRGVRYLAALAAGVAVLGLAACGGSDKPAVSAEQAVSAKAVLAVGNQLQAAFKQKDPVKICSLIEPVGLKKEYGGKKACIKRLGAAMNQAGDKANKGFTFKNVTVDGDKAVARNATGQGGDVFFIKVDGSWYIDVGPQPSDTSGSTGS